MEKTVLGQFSISMWVTLPAFDRDPDQARFKRVQFGVYHGVTEDRAIELKADFNAYNSELPKDSLVFEFKPYPTQI